MSDRRRPRGGREREEENRRLKKEREGGSGESGGRNLISPANHCSSIDPGDGDTVLKHPRGETSASLSSRLNTFLRCL